jgi:hypothetical protein
MLMTLSNVMLARCQSCARELRICYLHRYLLTAYRLFKEEGEDEDTTTASGTGDAITALDPSIPRSAPCEEWRIPVSELEVMVTKPESSYSEDQRNIRDTWNARIAMRYPRLAVADLYDWLRKNPLVVARNFMELVVSDPQRWVGLRDDLARSTDAICQTVELGMASSVLAASIQAVDALTNISDTLQPRGIQPDIAGEAMGQAIPDPNGEIPTLGRILDGIRAGE